MTILAQLANAETAQQFQLALDSAMTMPELYTYIHRQWLPMKEVDYKKKIEINQQ